MKAQSTNQRVGLASAGVVALATMTALACQSVASADDNDNGAVVVRGALTDLQAPTTEPLEGAEATLTMASHNGSSTFVLRVHGIDTSAAGRTFGAHLHVGQCVAGNGALAGGHYNAASPAVIDDAHEVWLDFTVTAAGTATSVAKVPFVAVPGDRSVIVHALATDHHTGGAGSRLACLPVSW